MTYVIMAIVLVGLLTAANMLLVFGVIRRLRQHTTEIAKLGKQDASAWGDVAASPGTEVTQFAATDDAGSPVGAEVLTGRRLVGFFSPDCEPCKERLPDFLHAASQRPGGRDEVLAVIVASQSEAASLLGQLSPVARVVVEQVEGAVQRAFGVKGFPAFVLIDDGQVVASDFHLASVLDREPTLVA